MVKRAKLTLDHPEAEAEAVTEKESEPEIKKTIRENAMVVQTPRQQSNLYSKLGKVALLAGVTIALLVIFKRKA